MISRMTMYLAAIAVIFGLSFNALADEKKVIAVGEPSSLGRCKYYDANLAEAMMVSLRNYINQTGAFKVVSNRQMKAILNEHKLSMVGLVDPEKAKSLGDWLQADYLLSVDFICLPEHIELAVNLTDIEKRENVFTKQYPMDLRKTRRTLKDLTKLLKRFAKTGETGGDAGDSEIFQLVDSKAFQDATEYIVKRIIYTIPKAYGTIEEVNVYGDELKVNIRYSGFKPWAGLKFKVEHDGEEVGWLFLKKSGRGKLQAGTTGDMSAFEEGDKISSEDFEPVVAIGYIEDVDEGEDRMVDMFKDRMQEIFEQSDGVKPAEGRKIDRILNRMGKRTRKKDLAKLHKAGVDLLLVGRFLGPNKNRRLDFDVISTYNGKRVIEIKRDRIGL